MFAAVDRGTARTPWEFSLGLGSSGSTGASSFPRRIDPRRPALAHRDAETRRETLVPGPRPRARGRRARADRARRDVALRAPIARARFAPTRRARARRAPRRAGRTRRENAIATRGAPGADARKNEQSRRSGDADLLTSDGRRAATCTNAAPNMAKRFPKNTEFPNAHRKNPNALPWSASVHAPHPTHTPNPPPLIATESHLRAHLDHMVKGFERESRLRVPRGQMRDVVAKATGANAKALALVRPDGAEAARPRRRRRAGRRLGRLPGHLVRRERERPRPRRRR